MNCCDFNSDLTKYKTKIKKECYRISPKGQKKSFKVPRRFSKKRCIYGQVKGFTMRSSCAPYKYCRKKKKGGSRKKMSIQKNFHGKKLKSCSTNPMTGWYRNGFCEKYDGDNGLHTVCALMDKKFLDYTKSQGNNLYSVVNPGQKWCLCERRWEQAFDDNSAPQVVLGSTNYKVDDDIKQKILKNQNWIYNSKTNTGRSLFTNDNPTDTIKIKYKTVYDVKKTIVMLKRLLSNKKYTFRRIKQVAFVLKQRLQVLKNRFPNTIKIDTKLRLADDYYQSLRK